MIFFTNEHFQSQPFYYMEQILVELVGLERAQQLWNTPTLDLAHENFRLEQLSTILYRHCRNELYMLPDRLERICLFVRKKFIL